MRLAFDDNFWIGRAKIEAVFFLFFADSYFEWKITGESLPLFLEKQ